ncbi:hypothetical protein REPUB_Repub04eG0240800 [Reevesia pubescens]
MPVPEFIFSSLPLSPKQVSTMEHVCLMDNFKLDHYTRKVELLLIVCNAPLLFILAFSLILAILSLLVYLEKYLLAERKGIISVIMHKDSTAVDILKSYIHALVMANLMDEKRSLHLESQSWMNKQYEIFVQKLKSSAWKTERLLCPSIIWKVHWHSESLDEKTD